MVVTVTINPAMDVVMSVDKFRLNVTNRVQKKFSCVGGKGTHVSINLSLMGIRSKAAGVVMGPVGDEILNALARYDIDIRFIKLDEGNSRTNYVLTDSDGNCTLIAEKGQMMDQSVTDRLVSHYSELVERGDMVVISGDASNQRDTGLQEKLMDIASEKGARFSLDASGIHLEAGIRKRPFLIKPNLDELSCLCGRELSNEAEILSALREVSANGAENIIASCGGDGSYALLDGRLYRVFSPAVEVRNTVGCGDALLSGIIAGYEKKMATVEILKKATAAAAATAMNEATVGFDPEIAAKLEAEVIVKELAF